MAAKRKHTVRKAASPARIKTLCKQVAQWKLKFAKFQKQAKLKQEHAYKKGFQDALKAIKKMEKGQSKLWTSFQKECKKAISKKKTTRRKTAKRAATKRKAAPKKRQATTKRKSTRKVAAKRKTTRKTSLKVKARATTRRKKKAAPRGKTIVRKVRARTRVSPARRSSTRSNSAYRSH